MLLDWKQMTITWHTDNLKILHVDAYEVTKVIDWMKVICGSHMEEYLRKKNDYLGMDLYLLVDREVRVTMTYYLKKILSEFHETIHGSVENLAADHMFTVREDTDSKLLDKYQSTAFHHTVYQLLSATARVMNDIQTSVEFLTTRVRITDKDDWRKL